MHQPVPDDTTQARWLVGVNTGTSEIPAFSLVKVTATDTSGRFEVAEPDAADNVIYVVGDLAIPAADDDGDGVGAITGDWPAWAAYDPDDGTPAIGETWGHEAGTFLLKKDAPGFRVVSEPDEVQEIVRVERTSAEDDADCCGWSADVWTRHEEQGTTEPTWSNTVNGVVAETEMAFDSTGFTKFVIHGTIQVEVYFHADVPTSYHPVYITVDAAIAIVDASGNYLGLVTTFVPVVRGQIFNALNQSSASVTHYTGDARRIVTPFLSSGYFFNSAMFEGQGSAYFFYSTAASATLGPASTYERTAWYLRGSAKAIVNSQPINVPCTIRVLGLGTGGTWLVMDRICCETDALDPMSATPPQLPPPPPPSNLAPVASFTHSPQSGPQVLVVGFVDTSSNTPTSWSWTFGDGDTSTEQHPVHRYTEVGVYPVTLTACNSYGCSTATGTVTVTRSDTGQFKARVAASPPPIAYRLQAGFAIEPTESGTAPLTVRFANSTYGGIEPIRYVFNYGDGTGTIGLPGEHIYTSLGSFTATLVATDATGRQSVARKAITVIMPAGAGDGSLTASFGAAPPFATPPYTATFTDTSSTSGDPITTWAWAFGDGGTSSAQNPTHDYPGPGTYHVTLTVSHATDSDTAEQDIVIP